MAVVIGRNPVGPQRGRAVRVPGIYARYHQRAAEAQAMGAAEREHDPRFDPDDMSQAECAGRDADYRRVKAEALARADELAAQRIAQGRPLLGKLLSPGLRPRNVPLLRDPDLIVDIAADDTVSVNVEATAAWKRQRAAEAEQRATVQNRNV